MARVTFRQSGSVGSGVHHQARHRRPLQRHRVADRSSQEVLLGLGGRGPARSQAQRQTDIPSDAEALSPVHATVADAVRLGADAVGYTMCVGTPAQERDFAQFHQIREDAERLRMPLIVWAYPRGAAIEAKGGKNSFDAVDYAARAASELGADVVKVNFPNPETRDAVKEPYRAEFSSQRGHRCCGSLGQPHAAAGLRW